MDGQILEHSRLNSDHTTSAGTMKQSALMDIISFLIGLFSAYSLSLGGQLYLAELILPFFILFLWRPRSHLLRNRDAKWLFLSGLGWLTAQIVTDLVRSTSPGDFLRGWALITVFLVDLLGLYLLLYPYPRRIVISLSGFVLGGILQPLLQPDIYFRINTWKFGFGQPLTLLLLTIGCIWAGKSQRRNLLLAIPVGALGLYSLYADSRSLGAITLFTSLLLVFRATFIGRILTGQLRIGNLIGLGLVVAAMAWGILSMYTTAARSGWLGNVTRVNYQLEFTQGLRIFVSGRSEMIPALHAIQDSPIIGHGSWARDPQYRNYLYDLIRLGYISPNETARIDYMVSASNTIPTHSHILQGWVWSGLIGAIFWISILFILLRALLTTLRLPNLLFSLVIFVSLLSIWNTLFSPFGSIMRLQWAYSLVICLYALAPLARKQVAAKDQS